MSLTPGSDKRRRMQQRRRSLPQVEDELSQKMNEQETELENCRNFFRAVEPGIEDDEITKKQNYQIILQSFQRPIEELKSELNELEKEEIAAKKAMMRNLNNSSCKQGEDEVRQSKTTRDECAGDTKEVDDGDNKGGGDDDGTDSQDEDEDDEVEEDICESDVKDEIVTIQRSNLFIALQGLRGKISFPGCDTTTGEEVAGNATDDDQVSVVTYNGRIFHRNKCYHYREPTKGRVVIVGIIGFVNPKASHASCVLVVPFSDTFLGRKEEGVDFNPNDFQPPSTYVRVQHELDPLPLDMFMDPFKESECIPDLVYEPQTPGDWCNFAYYYDFKRERCGRRQEKIKTLDLFSGCGGMSQGLHSTGRFTTTCAVEKEKKPAEAFELNHPEAKVCQMNVNDWLHEFESGDKFGDFQHVHASTPCQGFSGANRLGGVDDKDNNDLSLTVTKAVETITPRPSIVSFENVTGMWKRKHQHYLRTILSRLLMELGYQVRCCTLNAADYGDCQDRQRLFIIAAKKCVYLPRRPPKTHGKGTCIDTVTVGDALRDGGGSEMISVEEKNVEPTVTNDGTQVLPKGATRLIQDAPAPTIRCSNVLFHPIQNRRITIDEMKSLFSLPLTYQLVGNLSDKSKQIGNSVPVELGAAVGRSIADVLQYKYVDE